MSPNVPDRDPEYMESAAQCAESQKGSWVRIWLGREDTMIRPEVQEWQLREYGVDSETTTAFVEKATHNGMLQGGGPIRDAWLWRWVLREVAASEAA